MGSDSTKSMASTVFRPDQSSICSNDLHILHWLCERANITCYNDDISQFVDLVANHVWVSIHGGCPKIDGFFRGNTKISKMSWITRGSPWYPYDSGNQHVLTSMMYNSLFIYHQMPSGRPAPFTTIPGERFPTRTCPLVGNSAPPYRSATKSL